MVGSFARRCRRSWSWRFVRVRPIRLGRFARGFAAFYRFHRRLWRLTPAEARERQRYYNELEHQLFAEETELEELESLEAMVIELNRMGIYRLDMPWPGIAG